MSALAGSGRCGAIARCYDPISWAPEGRWRAISAYRLVARDGPPTVWVQATSEAESRAYCLQLLLTVTLRPEMEPPLTLTFTFAVGLQSPPPAGAAAPSPKTRSLTTSIAFLIGFQRPPPTRVRGRRRGGHDDRVDEGVGADGESGRRPLWS